MTIAIEPNQLLLLSAIQIGASLLMDLFQVVHHMVAY